jgi:hypothetical protein
MEISNEETTLLSNLIRQSQNNLNENLINKEKCFDDLTKLNKRINYLNEQVCLILKIT